MRLCQKLDKRKNEKEKKKQFRSQSTGSLKMRVVKLENLLKLMR